LEARLYKLASLCAVVTIAAVMCVPISGLFGVVGASAQDEETETALRVGFMQKVDSLNPMVGLTDAAYVFYGLVYDALHSVGDDFETVGNIATNWSIVPVTDPAMVASGEPYGSVWEFDLNPHAKWHDGEPFTAEDAEWVIDWNGLYYDSWWAYQPYAYFMEYAEVMDRDTIRIHFYERESKEPIPAAYAELICIPMIPRHKLATTMTPFDIAFNWTGTYDDGGPPIVGTGPFIAGPDIEQEYFDGSYLTLLKNPNYHWADRGKEIQFDKLVMYFFDDATSMNLALKKGELDIAQFPPSEYDSIKSDVEGGSLSDVEVFDGLKCTQYWTEIAFNLNEAGPNLARLDPAVRQALAMATNKQWIVDQYYMGYADVGSTMISPVNELWHYAPTADELFEFDLDAAEEMLEDAGYRYTTESPNVRVATVDSLAAIKGWAVPGDPLIFEMMIRIEYPEEREIAAYLKEVWEDIGVVLDYDVMTEAQLGTKAYSYAYDTMIWYWSADPDPNFMLFSQSAWAINGWNDNMYADPDYMENYSKSISEFDYETRKEYTDTCQRLHYLDAGYIILAYPYQTYAWRTDTFEGWGDWEAHPGRSMDAFWTGNPLFFDLVPLVDDGGGGGGDIDPMVILAAVAVIAIVVIAVVALILMKKKKGGEKEDKGSSPLGD
jgi:peptide/nickel transport system substrate-binding protein